MDEILRLIAMHPRITPLVTMVLMLFGMAMAMTRFERRPILAPYLAGSSMLLGFLLLSPCSTNWNPHVSSRQIDESKMRDLAELRTDYPAMAYVIRAAAADGRIDNGEYSELMEGHGTYRIQHIYRERQKKADRMAVMQDLTAPEKTS